MDVDLALRVFVHGAAKPESPPEPEAAPPSAAATRQAHGPARNRHERQSGQPSAPRAHPKVRAEAAEPALAVVASAERHSAPRGKASVLEVVAVVFLHPGIDAARGRGTDKASW